MKFPVKFWEVFYVWRGIMGFEGATYKAWWCFLGSQGCYVYSSILFCGIFFVVATTNCCIVILFLQSNLEMLGTLRERQIKLREDALVLQEQMTEFRNNVVKEVLAIFPKGESMFYKDCHCSWCLSNKYCSLVALVLMTWVSVTQL